MRFAAAFCFIFASSLVTGAVACDKKSATVAHGQFAGMGRVEPGSSAGLQPRNQCRIKCLLTL